MNDWSFLSLTGLSFLDIAGSVRESAVTPSGVLQSYPGAIGIKRGGELRF